MQKKIIRKDDFLYREKIRSQRYTEVNYGTLITKHWITK
jgi:hypothetical protein